MRVVLMKFHCPYMQLWGAVMIYQGSADNVSVRQFVIDNTDVPFHIRSAYPLLN